MSKLKISALALGLIGAMSITAQDNPAFDNGFTLKFGYVPGGKNFGDLSEMNTLNMSDYLTSKADYLSQISSGQTPSSVPVEPTQLINPKVKSGFGFELGTMFFLNSLPIHDKVRLGIDVTWFELYFSTLTYESYKLSGFNYKNTPRVYNGEDVKSMSLRPGCKVGLFISVNPIDKLAIDFAFRVNPIVNAMIMVPTTVYEETFQTVKFPTGETTNGNYSEQVGALQLGSGLRFVPGIFVRYKPFFLGVDFALGNLKHTGGSAGSVSLEDPSLPTGFTLEPSANIQKYKSKVNETRILLGFKF